MSIHFCITVGYCINGRVYTKIFFISEDLKRKISMNLTKVLSAKHPAVHEYERNIGCRIPSVIARTAAVRRISSFSHIRGKKGEIIASGCSKKLLKSRNMYSNSGIRIDSADDLVLSIKLIERIEARGEFNGK